MADIIVTLPSGQTETIPLPPGAPTSLPDALVQQIQNTINQAEPREAKLLMQALKSGDFTKFNRAVLREVNQILTEVETYPCFTEGTLIRTDRGDVRVEDLNVGDLVVTSDGGSMPIKWLGHRAVDTRRHSRPNEVMPVRVSASAVADNVPSSDLFVSPGHSLCIDVLGEVLIPAMALMNGTTITQEDVEQVVYWHVELEGGHNVIYANGMPTESYLEMDNRGFFGDATVVSLSASPDVLVVSHDDFCRPFYASGPMVDTIKARIASRVEMLGWHHEDQDLSTCRLVVDGVAIAPRRRDMSLLFKVPAGASQVSLESSIGIPAVLSSKSRDFRSLGVQVTGIQIVDGFSTIAVAMDDPRLSIGFHAAEMTTDKQYRRWTNGSALLPSSLWDRMEDDFFIRLDVGSGLLPKWAMPQERRDTLAA